MGLCMAASHLVFRQSSLVKAALAAALTAAALQEVCQRLLTLDPENDEAQMMLAEMQFQQVSHSVGQV